MRVLLMIFALMAVPFSAHSHSDDNGGYSCHQAANGEMHCHLSED